MGKLHNQLASFIKTSIVTDALAPTGALAFESSANNYLISIGSAPCIKQWNHNNFTALPITPKDVQQSAVMTKKYYTPHEMQKMVEINKNETATDTEKEPVENDRETNKDQDQNNNPDNEGDPDANTGETPSDAADITLTGESDPDSIGEEFEVTEETVDNIGITEISTETDIESETGEDTTGVDETDNTSTTPVDVIITTTTTTTTTTTPTPVSTTAPAVANAISNQAVTAGIQNTFTFAANTFSDPNGDTLTYSATQGDNSALPSWITFDSSTRTFTFDPTLSASLAGNSVIVTASDGSETVTDTFDFTVSNPGSGTLGTNTTESISSGTTMYGFGGDDTITGNTSIETFYGGTGNDTIIGNYDGDNINGGFGDDLIYTDSNQTFNNSLVTNLSVWLDGNDINGNGSSVTDSSSISSWQDKSGNNRDANDLSGGDTTDQPTANTDSIAGRTTLSFSDANDQKLDISAFDIGSNYSLFMVFQSNDSTSMKIFDTGQIGNPEPWLGTNGGVVEAATWNPSTNYGYISSAVSTGAGNENFHTVGYVYNFSSNQSELFVEGVSVGTSTAGYDPSANLIRRVGGHPFVDDFHDGEIAEVILYGKAVNSTEAQQINEYLSYKYNIESTGLNLGADSLTGGLGNDTFTWTNSSTSKTGTGNRDVITDFKQSGSSYTTLELDKIDLSDHNLSFIGTDSFSTTPNELRITSSGSNTILQASFGADQTADFEIQLTGNMYLYGDEFTGVN
ncbi:MAG: putative Ig domain-containing protein, partial [Gammaproteobacteria bacterium]|nr:putative Ig domain-containing protein [Gammaproteobacteria bacterium]